MLNFFKKNLELKILALLLAVVLWGYVQYTQSLWNEESSFVSLTLPVHYENLPSDMVLLEETKTVNLTLKGSAEQIKRVNPDSVKALVDLSGRKEGPYSLEIRLDAPSGVQVVNKEPGSARFNLETIQQQEFPVQVKTLDQPPTGRVIQGYKIKPIDVQLSGPISLLNKVKQVDAVVNLRQADAYLTLKTMAVPVDSQGLVVAGVKSNPAYITVEVNSALKLRPKTLVVKPQLMGSPASGFAVADVQVDPAFVTVNLSGRAGGDTEFIQTEPINIEKGKQTITRMVRLILPAGVTLLEDQDIKITIKFGKAR